MEIRKVDTNAWTVRNYNGVAICGIVLIVCFPALVYTLVQASFRRKLVEWMVSKVLMRWGSWFRRSLRVYYWSIKIIGAIVPLMASGCVVATGYLLYFCSRDFENDNIFTLLSLDMDHEVMTMNEAQGVWGNIRNKPMAAACYMVYMMLLILIAAFWGTNQFNLVPHLSIFPSTDSETSVWEAHTRREWVLAKILWVLLLSAILFASLANLWTIPFGECYGDDKNPFKACNRNSWWKTFEHDDNYLSDLSWHIASNWVYITLNTVCVIGAVFLSDSYVNAGADLLIEIQARIVEGLVRFESSTSSLEEVVHKVGVERLAAIYCKPSSNTTVNVTSDSDARRQASDTPQDVTPLEETLLRIKQAISTDLLKTYVEAAEGDNLQLLNEEDISPGAEHKPDALSEEGPPSSPNEPSETPVSGARQDPQVPKDVSEARSMQSLLADYRGFLRMCLFYSYGASLLFLFLHAISGVIVTGRTISCFQVVGIVMSDSIFFIKLSQSPSHASLAVGSFGSVRVGRNFPAWKVALTLLSARIVVASITSDAWFAGQTAIYAITCSFLLYLIFTEPVYTQERGKFSAAAICSKSWRGFVIRHLREVSLVVFTIYFLTLTLIMSVDDVDRMLSLGSREWHGIPALKVLDDHIQYWKMGVFGILLVADSIATFQFINVWQQITEKLDMKADRNFHTQKLRQARGSERSNIGRGPITENITLQDLFACIWTAGAMLACYICTAYFLSEKMFSNSREIKLMGGTKTLMPAMFISFFVYQAWVRQDFAFFAEIPEMPSDKLLQALAQNRLEGHEAAEISYVLHKRRLLRFRNFGMIVGVFLIAFGFAGFGATLVVENKYTVELAIGVSAALISVVCGGIGVKLWFYTLRVTTQFVVVYSVHLCCTVVAFLYGAKQLLRDDGGLQSASTYLIIAESFLLLLLLAPVFQLVAVALLAYRDAGYRMNPFFRISFSASALICVLVGYWVAVQVNGVSLFGPFAAIVFYVLVIVCCILCLIWLWWRASTLDQDTTMRPMQQAVKVVVALVVLLCGVGAWDTALGDMSPIQGLVDPLSGLSYFLLAALSSLLFAVIWVVVKFKELDRKSTRLSPASTLFGIPCIAYRVENRGGELLLDNDTALAITGILLVFQTMGFIASIVISPNVGVPISSVSLCLLVVEALHLSVARSAQFRANIMDLDSLDGLDKVLGKILDEAVHRCLEISQQAMMSSWLRDSNRKRNPWLRDTSTQRTKSRNFSITGASRVQSFLGAPVETQVTQSAGLGDTIEVEDHLIIQSVQGLDRYLDDVQKQYNDHQLYLRDSCKYKALFYVLFWMRSTQHFLLKQTSREEALPLKPSIKGAPEVLERLGNRQVFKGVVDLRENVLKCDDHKKKKAESQQAVSKELSRSERSRSNSEDWVAPEERGLQEPTPRVRHNSLPSPLNDLVASDDCSGGSSSSTLAVGEGEVALESHCPSSNNESEGRNDDSLKPPESCETESTLNGIRSESDPESEPESELEPEPESELEWRAAPKDVSLSEIHRERSKVFYCDSKKHEPKCHRDTLSTEGDSCSVYYEEFESVHSSGPNTVSGSPMQLVRKSAEVSVKAGQKFVDEEFPPSNGSLFEDWDDNDEVFKEQEDNPDFLEAVWCRPEEIFPPCIEELTQRKLCISQQNPEDSEYMLYDPSEVMQGGIGDCWLLSAISVLGLYPELLNRVLDSKAINSEGIYRVRLFLDGEWQTVVVDDQIPCSIDYSLRFDPLRPQDKPLVCNRSPDVLVGKSGDPNGVQYLPLPKYCRSRSGNVLWPLLIEKAFAKRFGSYEALDGGHVHTALVDLTGGFSQLFSLREDVEIVVSGALWDKMVLHLNRGALLGAGSRAIDDCGNECSEDGALSTDENGIVHGHAYAIVKVVELDDYNGKHRLLQLQDPWGVSRWQGRWSRFDKKRWTRRMQQLLEVEVERGFSSSDRVREIEERLNSAEDPEANSTLSISEEESEQALNLNQDQDQGGKFWISLEDFVSSFRWLYVCRLFSPTEWCQKSVKSAWKRETAGGPPNQPGAALNPQFLLKLKSAKHRHNDLHCFRRSTMVTLFVSISNLRGLQDPPEYGSLHNLCDSDGAGKVPNTSECNQEVREYPFMSLLLLDLNGERLSNKLLASQVVASTGNYKDSRDLSFETKVPYDENVTYTIFPSLFRKGDRAAFRINVYCQADFELSEMGR